MPRPHHLKSPQPHRDAARRNRTCREAGGRCTMCAGAIGWAQISRVVYGASDEKRGYTKYAPEALHPKTTVTSGVLEEECRALMVSFFERKR